MKSVKYYIIFILLGVITSCDDYLETTPYSFTSPENFYTTASEAEIALTGVYAVLTETTVQDYGNQSTYSRQLMFMLNGGVDECLTNHNFNNINISPWGVAGFTAESSYTEENWFFLYAGINRASYLIEKLDQIDDFDNNRKVEIEGEARLLRGFYHMMLSMIHGAIPVYTTSEQDPSASRESLDNVYAQIIEDYEFAYQNLPDRATVDSHVNKWTAASLLAKVYTYLGSAKKTGVPDFGFTLNSFDWVDADDCYAKALTYTTDVINNSGYILISNYDRLFRETTKQDQYQECMLTGEASSDASIESVNVILNAFVPQGNRNTVGGGYGNFRPLGELYNRYAAQDIRRDHNLTGNILNTADVETVDGVRYYIPRALPRTTVGYYCIGKYRMADPATKSIPTWASNISLPLLRYGDVVLLHAEAQYFTGDEDGARNTLTMLRERAVGESTTVETLNEAYYNSDFIQELLDERSRELCFENWRRIDLARFNAFDDAVEFLSAETTIGFYNVSVTTLKQNWKSEKIWIPIPLTQIDLNPNLIQNSGY